MSAETGSGIGAGISAAAPSGKSAISTAAAPSVESFSPAFSISPEGTLTSHTPAVETTKPLIANTEHFNPDRAVSSYDLSHTKAIRPSFEKVSPIHVEDRAFTENPFAAKKHTPKVNTVSNDIRGDFHISDFVALWQRPVIEEPASEPSLEIEEMTLDQPLDEGFFQRELSFNNEEIDEQAGLIESLTPDVTLSSTDSDHEPVVQENELSVLQSLAEQYIQTRLVPDIKADQELSAVTALDSEPSDRVDVVAKDHAIVIADTDFLQAKKVRDAMLAVGVDEKTATESVLDTFDKLADDRGYREELEKKVAPAESLVLLLEPEIEDEPEQKSVLAEEERKKDDELMAHIDEETDSERLTTVKAIIEKEFEKAGDNEDRIVDGSEVVAQLKLDPQDAGLKSDPLQDAKQHDGSLTQLAAEIREQEFDEDNNYEGQITDSVSNHHAVTYEPVGTPPATDEQVAEVFSEQQVPASFSYPLNSLTGLRTE